LHGIEYRAPAGETEDLCFNSHFPGDPIQIGSAALSDRQTNDLGNFVGVIFQEGLFEFFVIRHRGLDEKENFFGGFFSATPAIMGFKPGKDLNAGREPSRN
jgi:hypothetical protein